MGDRNVRRVLQLAPYRRLLGAYTINELAVTVGAVALSYLIYHRTGSAIGAAAFYLCALFLPALISPLLVARIDQWPVRKILPALYVLESVIFLMLGWLAGRFALGPVLVLTILDGTIAVSARSLGRAATVSVTSAAGLLREGNALANTLFCISFMAGPTIGGAVVALGGESAALFANAGLFAVVALTLGTAAGLPNPRANRAPSKGRVRAALAYVTRHPNLRALLSLQALGLIFFTISMPVEVVFAQRSLHAGAAGYGILMSSWGAGAVAGSTAYMRWRALPVRQLMAVGAALLGCGFVVMAMAPDLGIAVAGSAIAGIGNGIEAVSARTAVQEGVEEEWMARMMSFNESLSMSAPGLGIVIGGAVTALAGPRIALATAGGGAFAVTALIWVVLGSTSPRAPTATEPGQRDAPTQLPATSSAARQV